MSFENKVVLVTGSGSGIGEATVKEFAKNGANVIIVDINNERTENVAEICKQFGNKVLGITADVTKFEEAENILKETIDTFGRLDILINNAGILGQPSSILQGTILDQYDHIMNTNLRSVVVMTTLFAPHLIKTKGCIVNISSVASTDTRCGKAFPACCIAKTGLDSFTRLSALEFASSGVRVNSVNPGPVRTNLMADSGISGDWEKVGEKTALGKTADPEEVASLIVYVCSDRATSITGVTYVIDNGMALINH
ncbi:uncharacterized protein LOC113502806 [Trichoplusia ni]|uniref:Uncharacterized protein LOC113502806 n=1 Tax=Trichoplusia ni TaxID=7111 RepID=A0A7E5WJ04_TRINI|nr:uncharacterized protein LOC113502806 [Trichoplusia ni]